MNSRFAILACALVAGCDLQNYSSGTVRGRVVTAAGVPVANARVMLDEANGRATISNYRGEFRLGGATEGHHKVYALDASRQYAAAVAVDVEGGAADAGDLVLVDCAAVVSGSGTPDGPIGGEAEPAPTPGPNDDGYADVGIPCSAEPPPPPPESFVFASLTATYADGFVDPSMIYVFGEDVEQGVGFDVYVLGDFTSGGVATVHVEPTQNFADAHMGLFVRTEQWGYYYVLRSGDLTVSVYDDGDGDAATLGYSLEGSNLAFDLVGWDGAYDGSHTASVGTLVSQGIAAQYIPPPPPTSDITIPTFVADWVDLIVCDLCAPDGDALFVYAYDTTAAADLSFLVPLSAFATLPGSTQLLATEGEYASASVYRPEGSWYYGLTRLDVSIASSAITVGQPLSLSVSNGEFLYQWAGGPVVVDGGGGGSAPPPGSEPQFKLFVSAGDLSAVVGEWKESDPSGGGTPAPQP